MGSKGHPDPHPRPPSTDRPAAAGPVEHKPTVPPAGAEGSQREPCPCACHATGVDVHIQVTTQRCCVHAEAGHQHPPSGEREPPSGRSRDPTGKLPDPPTGVPRDPWDIMQVILKTCRGDTPPPRKDSYLPYLVVRANPGDRGQRPLPPGTVFWESPDIFVMPNQPAAGAPAVPANLGGMAQAGAPNTIFAHVWNLGRGPAFDVRVEFYWFNPTLGIEEADANLIGFTYITLGQRNSPKSHAVVRCPVDWVPTFVNDGHECLVVRAYSVISDPLTHDAWSASLNRHVAQRNIAVLRGAQAQASPLVLGVAPGHSVHDAQIVTVGVHPGEVPWMQLISGRRGVTPKPAATTPIAGIMPPAFATGAGNRRPDLRGISTEALAQLLSARHRFVRAADPAEVTFLARAPALGQDEAHVVRIQQLHENELVGGYTTILLP